ncbi:related to n-alkane-inducible cytochrome P450 [Phialocephala subalpina]|uniref:Related to n-alkane-inducible cytochrome P450 n=1 Tax=Phialocephala subalpina TaxID=576137 RepID=A0A1L7WN32_9HELO|nr:related to n-alkane-inducible cytochrome P450 [Phialocephala subalpina]
MSYLYIKEILAAFTAWVVFVQVRNWLRWRSLNKWAAAQGCKEPPNVPNHLPGGIERYGFVIQLLLGRLKNFDFLDDNIRKRNQDMGCNTFRIHNAFNETILSTCDPENIQAILATRFHDFDLGPQRHKMFEEMLGHGIFTAEGEKWSHFRRQLKPQFARDQVSDLEATERHLNVLFKVLPEENQAGWIESVDLLPLLYRLTMDLSTEFLFGQSVNSQSNALYSLDSGNTSTTEALEQIAFSEAMQYAQEFIAWRFRIRMFYVFITKDKFKAACATVQNFTSRFVSLALSPDRKHVTETAKGKPKFTLIDELVKETRDPIELRDQMLHVLLAGRDTTSATIGWAILLLSRSPTEFNKLRSAILAQFGTENNPISEPTFESLKACKEITYVIYETLRLYPLVPLNGRFALKDTVLPTGGGPDRKSPIAVKKGEQVGFSTYIMHRRRDIWGSDADEFRPSRWEGRKLGWEFVPFSGGPRVCLGQQYALNNAGYVLAKLLQRYDQIEALDMVKPLKKGLAIVLAPGDGVKVRMHRASA